MTQALPSFLGEPVEIQLRGGPKGPLFDAAIPPGFRRDIPGFAVEGQERTEWCWAALTQAMLRHYGASAGRQCDVATTFLGFDCCTDDRENRPQVVENVLTKFGILRGAPVNGSVGEDIVVSEVDRDRPLAVRVDFRRRSHVIAIGGYARGYDGLFYLLVHDPAYGGAAIGTLAKPFAYEGGRWGGTFKTRSPGNGG